MGKKFKNVELDPTLKSVQNTVSGGLDDGGKTCKLPKPITTAPTQTLEYGIRSDVGGGISPSKQSLDADGLPHGYAESDLPPSEFSVRDNPNEGAGVSKKYSSDHAQSAEEEAFTHGFSSFNVEPEVLRGKRDVLSRSDDLERPISSYDENVAAGLDPQKDLGLDPITGITSATQRKVDPDKIAYTQRNRRGKPQEVKMPKHIKRDDLEYYPENTAVEALKKRPTAKEQKEVDARTSSGYKFGEKGDTENNPSWKEANRVADKDTKVKAPKTKYEREVMTRKGETRTDKVYRPNREDFVDLKTFTKRVDRVLPSDNKSYGNTLKDQELEHLIIRDKNISDNDFLLDNLKGDASKEAADVRAKEVLAQRESKVNQGIESLHTKVSVKLDRPVGAPPSIVPELEVQWRKRNPVSNAIYKARENKFMEIYNQLSDKQKVGVEKWNRHGDANFKGNPTHAEMREQENALIMMLSANPNKSKRDILTRGLRKLESDSLHVKAKVMTNQEFGQVLAALKDVKSGKVQYGYDFDFWKKQDPEGYAKYIENNDIVKYVERKNAELVRLKIEEKKLRKARNKDNKALDEAIIDRKLEEFYSETPLYGDINLGTLKPGEFKTQLEEMQEYLNREGVKYWRTSLTGGAHGKTSYKGRRTPFSAKQDAIDSAASKQATLEMIKRDQEIIDAGGTPTAEYTFTKGKVRRSNESTGMPYALGAAKREGKKINPGTESGEKLAPDWQGFKPKETDLRILELDEGLLPGREGPERPDHLKTILGRSRASNPPQYGKLGSYVTDGKKTTVTKELKNIGNAPKSLGFETLTNVMSKNKAKQIVDSWDDVVSLRPKVEELVSKNRKTGDFKPGITPKNVYGVKQLQANPYGPRTKFVHDKGGKLQITQDPSKGTYGNPSKLGDREPAKAGIFENTVSGDFSNNYKALVREHKNLVKNGEENNLFTNEVINTRVPNKSGRGFHSEKKTLPSAEYQLAKQERYIERLKEELRPKAPRTEEQERVWLEEQKWLYDQGIQHSRIFDDIGEEVLVRKSVPHKTWNTIRRNQFNAKMNKIGQSKRFDKDDYADILYIAKKLDDNEWSNFLKDYADEITRVKGIEVDALNPFRRKVHTNDPNPSKVKLDDEFNHNKTNSYEGSFDPGFGDENLKTFRDVVVGITSPTKFLDGTSGKVFEQLWMMSDITKRSKELEIPGHVELAQKEYRDLAVMLHAYDVNGINTWISKRKNSRIKEEKSIFNKGGRPNAEIISDWRHDLALEEYVRSVLNSGYGSEAFDIPHSIFVKKLDKMIAKTKKDHNNLLNKTLKGKETLLRSGAAQKEDTINRYLKLAQDLYSDEELFLRDKFIEAQRVKETNKEKARRVKALREFEKLTT